MTTPVEGVDFVYLPSRPPSATLAKLPPDAEGIRLALWEKNRQLVIRKQKGGGDVATIPAVKFGQRAPASRR